MEVVYVLGVNCGLRQRGAVLCSGVLCWRASDNTTQSTDASRQGKRS